MAKKGDEGSGITVAIVASEYNYDVSSLMLERAKEEIDFLGARLGPIVRTPGVFDMPLAVKLLLDRKEVDAVVALGAVIEGETDHDQVVMQQASRKLADLMVDHEKPVGLGISGPGETRLQAQDRIENAAQAVRAVVKMAKRLDELRR
ncbi:MAG: 6,7-dimethyl-8-ribityllumazine synthase [Thermoplasmata archaeon]|nr:6,7-dimethyl-8-ribityllumazine synthase [Thermoplasmata archaeon]MCI4363255.1 6,7-dimethyl-8-ribityllumazine synthase [Thermoplasmata archaeon]